jgi:hypothetical protein
MNKGVEILLARMESNPEEFAYNPNEGAGKWSRLLENFKHCFTQEEITAVEEGIKNIERSRFTELVMEELLDPKSLEDVIKQYRATGISSVGQIQGLYSNGVGCNAALLDAQKYQTEQMKAHLDAHRMAIKQEEKKHKTLFGKLFNYS